MNARQSDRYRECGINLNISDFTHRFTPPLRVRCNHSLASLRGDRVTRPTTSFV